MAFFMQSEFETISHKTPAPRIEERSLLEDGPVFIRCTALTTKDKRCKNKPWIHPETGRVLPFCSSHTKDAFFKKQDLSTCSWVQSKDGMCCYYELVGNDDRCTNRVVRGKFCDLHRVLPEQSQDMSFLDLCTPSEEKCEYTELSSKMFQGGFMFGEESKFCRGTQFFELRRDRNSTVVRKKEQVQVMHFDSKMRENPFSHTQTHTNLPLLTMDETDDIAQASARQDTSPRYFLFFLLLVKGFLGLG